MIELVLYHRALGRDFRHVLDQGGGIIDPIRQDRRGRVLQRPHHADDRDVLAVPYQLPHVAFIVPLVRPDIIFAVILIVVCRVHQFIGGPDDLIIRVEIPVFHFRYLAAFHGLIDQIHIFIKVLQTQRIDHIIRHGPRGADHQDALVVVLRPAPGHDLIGIDIEILIFGHLEKGAQHGERRRHHAGQRISQPKPGR